MPHLKTFLSRRRVPWPARVALATLLLWTLQARAASDGAMADEETLKLGRLSADFWAGRLDALWPQMGSAMREALGATPSGLATARERITSDTGGPGEALSERVDRVQGLFQYRRTFESAPGAGTWVEEWTLKGGTVVGFYVRPAPGGKLPPAYVDEALRVGRSLSADFWAGRLDAIWAHMSPAMREALGGVPAGLAKARETITSDTGGPGETLSERLEEAQGLPVYRRTFRSEHAPGTWLEEWALKDGTVVGFHVLRP